MIEKVLLNFSVTKLEDMIEKGNVWYTLHYREYFDKYVCAYLMGRGTQNLERNGVSLISLGTGRPVIDLVMGPLRVYRLAKRIRATHFISADLVLAWWHSLLLRLIRGTQVTVMPICNPSEILQTSGKSYSGLPTWLERVLIQLSFRAAARILCVETDDSGIAWVRSTGFEKKLKIVGVLPEEFSAPEFLDGLAPSVDSEGGSTQHDPVQLVFVGRLEKEKLVEDLIDAMSHLNRLGKRFVLTIIGDGAERPRLESKAAAGGLERQVFFAGFVPAREVAKTLSGSDIFVSPYTGTAIREAALAGLAIVGYRLGGIEKLFSDGENCLLTDPGDSRGMAQQIAALIDAPRRRRELGVNAQRMAQQVWSRTALRLSLKEAFDDHGAAF